MYPSMLYAIIESKELSPLFENGLREVSRADDEKWRGGDFTRSKPTKVGSPYRRDADDEITTGNAHRVAEIEIDACRDENRRRRSSHLRIGCCTQHRVSSVTVLFTCWCKWVVYLTARQGCPCDVARADCGGSRPTISIYALQANLHFREPKSTDTEQSRIQAILSWLLF